MKLSTKKHLIFMFIAFTYEMRDAAAIKADMLANDYFNEDTAELAEYVDEAIAELAELEQD